MRRGQWTRFGEMALSIRIRRHQRNFPIPSNLSRPAYHVRSLSDGLPRPGKARVHIINHPLMSEAGSQTGHGFVWPFLSRVRNEKKKKEVKKRRKKKGDCGWKIFAKSRPARYGTDRRSNCFFDKLHAFQLYEFIKHKINIKSK